MPKRFIRFNLSSDESKKHLFLKDPRSDFLVVLEKKVFPLHKDVLMASEFFSELISRNRSSATINVHLNVP